MSRQKFAWPLAFLGFAAGVTGIVIFSADVRVAVGQPKAPVVTPAPQAPTLSTPANLGVKRGEMIELVLTGTNLADAVSVVLSCPGKSTIPADNKNGTDPGKLRVKIEVPADCPIGLYTIRVVTKHGASNMRPLVVDELPTVAESDANRTKEAAQLVTIPAVVTGRTDTEASDYFKVKVGAGQVVSFEVLARRIGSPLDPIIVLHDAKTKRELIELYADDTPGLQSDCRLTHKFKEGGEFLVEVRDTTYKGGPDYFYRLRVGDFPGAMTAYPVAVQRGKSTSIGFAGSANSDIPAVSITAPASASQGVVYVTPKKSGTAGWPLPVLLSDWPELTEQEPNNEPAKANKLPVPGGVSGRFEKTGDVDHYAVACKKGVKYTAVAKTFEINSPCEVLIRVLDPKGAEIARSNPAQPAPRVEFTPGADGELVIACEQLNYLSGPNEIYHVAIQPATPSFTVALSIDRCEAPAGSGTAIMATVNRLNGFAGPVELSIVGDPVVSGKTVLPAGQTFAFIPVLVKSGTRAGAYTFQVQGKASVDGNAVVSLGTLTDVVKSALGGIPNPPTELLNTCVVAVLEQPAFAMKLTSEPASIEKGKTGKVVFEVTRDKNADGEIAVTPLNLPPNVTAAAAKPISKGSNKTELVLTVAPSAASGQTPVQFRATTKIGGKDYTVTPAPLVVDVIEAKKTESKQDQPKKDGKKDELKKDAKK